jgi:putative hydrolase of the HAD superfamily
MRLLANRLRNSATQQLVSKMFKAIAFDLWETLITDTPELSRRQERLRLQRIERTLEASGHLPVSGRLEHAYRDAWRRCHELYWSADRDVPCRRQVMHLLEALEVDAERFPEAALAEMEDAYANAALEILPEIVPGAQDLLRELKGRGFALGLISNTGRTPGSALRAILERLEMAPYIDAMVFSNEHGECKPRRSIFDRLRRDLGVDWGEMLFVGDNLYVDVHGAQQCGMRAIHFFPPVRGTAVAPLVEHDLEIVPDAVIRDLRDLPGAIGALASGGEQSANGGRTADRGRGGRL